MSIKKAIYIVLLAIALALLGYFMYWFYQSNRIREVLDEFKIECRAQGIDFSYDELSFSTFSSVSGTLYKPKFSSRDGTNMLIELGDINFSLEKAGALLTMSWNSTSITWEDKESFEVNFMNQEPQPLGLKFEGMQSINIHFKTSLFGAVTQLQHSAISEIWSNHLSSIEWTAPEIELSNQVAGHYILNNCILKIDNQGDDNYDKSQFLLECDYKAHPSFKDKIISTISTFAPGLSSDYYEDSLSPGKISFELISGGENRHREGGPVSYERYYTLNRANFIGGIGDVLIDADVRYLNKMHPILNFNIEVQNYDRLFDFHFAIADAMIKNLHNMPFRITSMHKRKMKYFLFKFGNKTNPNSMEWKFKFDSDNEWSLNEHSGQKVSAVFMKLFFADEDDQDQGKIQMQVA